MTKAKYGNMSDFAILVNLIANKVNIEILKLLGLKHIQLRIKNLMQTAILNLFRKLMDQLYLRLPHQRGQNMLILHILFGVSLTPLWYLVKEKSPDSLPSFDPFRNQ